MRRSLLPLLPCLVLGCADRPATAVVAAIAVDPGTRTAVQSVRLRAYRGQDLRFTTVLSLDELARPGTLTFRDGSRGDDGALLRLVLDGLSTPPPAGGAAVGAAAAHPGARPLADAIGGVVDPGDAAVLVRRSARLGFVKEKSKLMRMGLSASCLGVPCGADETCQNGSCTAEDVDPDTLPDAPGDLGGVGDGDFDDLRPACASGAVTGDTLYVDAASCRAGEQCGSQAAPFCTIGAAALAAAGLLAGARRRP